MIVAGGRRAAPVVPHKFCTLLRGSNKFPNIFQPPDHQELGIDSPFDDCFPRPKVDSEGDYRPARFAVPSNIDTQILYEGEEEIEISDDEEALKNSYASVMERLKGGAENTTVYHAATFRPQHYSSEQPPPEYKQQYHEAQFLQKQQQQLNYTQFQQQSASLSMPSDALTRMLEHDYKQKLDQGRALLETAHLRQSGVGESRGSAAHVPASMSANTRPAVPAYMRPDAGIRADMAYQQAKGAFTLSLGPADSGKGAQLENWLQEGVGAYMQAHAKQQHHHAQHHTETYSRSNHKPTGRDEEEDSLMGSFKSIQNEIYKNLGVKGGVVEIPDDPHAAISHKQSVPTTLHLNIDYAQQAEERANGGAGCSMPATRPIAIHQSPTKRTDFNITPQAGGHRVSSACRQMTAQHVPSLVVAGASNCGAGALSLAANTTRQLLKHHYDIDFPTAEDMEVGEDKYAHVGSREEWELGEDKYAILGEHKYAIAPSSASAMPRMIKAANTSVGNVYSSAGPAAYSLRTSTAEPAAYEPIFRYPVDCGGDASLDVPGFVKRAAVLGDDGEHWAVASNMIRQHIQHHNHPTAPLIRGSYPGATRVPGTATPNPSLSTRYNTHTHTHFLLAARRDGRVAGRRLERASCPPWPGAPVFSSPQAYACAHARPLLICY